MSDTYHGESYHEQMEAQEGPYDHNEPPMLFPSDVDAALRRIESALESLTPALRLYPPAILSLQNLIAEERERLGLPKEANV